MIEIDKIKKNINNTPTGVLNDLMSDHSRQLEIGSYVGIVVDNNDPEKLGRCRIRVYSVFGGDIPDDMLPWAIPEFNFVGSLKGSFIVPQIGATVKVVFERGEINLPKYSTKVLNIHQLPSRKDDNYPNNMIFFETDNGDSFEINRITSETTFIHNTGTQITINQDGTIDIHSSKKINVTHDDNLFVDGIINPLDAEPMGPFCSLPTCLYTGALHTTRTCRAPDWTPLTGRNETIANEVTEEQ